MHSLFDLLGGFLTVYTAYAAATGSVYTRHRAWGRTVTRGEQPGYFWTVIAIYGALAVALILYFQSPYRLASLERGGELWVFVKDVATGVRYRVAGF